MPDFQGASMLKSFALMLLATASLAAAELSPGLPAPPFEARDQAGKTIRLADFKGTSAVVLYFYPKDDTPGCTAEACSLRDAYTAILATGAVVLGVSADNEASHGAFAAKYHLPFSILADPDKRIISDYGVKVPVLGIAKRWTFIIDKQGLIRNIINDVDTKNHDQQVLSLLKAL
jgi:thioredoxin-dependent peroxiredoxin